MSTDIQVVTESNVNDVLKEVQDSFYDIPFENSKFQTEAFVIAAQVTPERAYRAIGLQMHSKIQAIREAKYNMAKEDIDIEELRDKITRDETTPYDKRRFQLEIDFKLSARDFSAKMLNDALTELNLLYTHFKKFPKYTREQFEQGEKQHFGIKLTKQLHNAAQAPGAVGALESIQNMEQDLPLLFSTENELLKLK